ncbi:MAG TPA: DUF4173 domain-containing protein [Anaerolineales bacterium]|nr:DUF4173 domain-containing protein [Anaerolineales bacterium]
MESKKQPSSDATVAAIPAAQVPATKTGEQAARARIHIKQPVQLGLVVLFLGWLFDLLFWKSLIGANFALFSVISVLAGLILLVVEGYRPARNTLWLLLPFLFFVVITMIRQEPLTIFLAYTFVLFSMGLLASTYLGGRWFQYGLADYFSKVIRLLAGILYLPTEFFTQVRKEQVERESNKRSFPLWALVRGVVIAIPIVALFAFLLASADVVFKQKLGEFFALFNPGNLAEYFLRLILILICAYIVGGVFLHAASQSRDEKLIGEEKPVVKPFLGFTESAVVLASVSILFIAFVIIQFQYFFGGETNIGVAGYTYSQYARRGFNELVIVAFCSLVMILGLSTVTRREHETEKRIYSGLSVGIVALVMVILVSAYQRISLAIDWHGFSRLRIYPRVFLVWLGVLLVAVVLLEIFRRERYFAFAAVLASLGFAISLTLVNVDAAIVKHNVPRVLQGKNLNVAHLASLSADAVPALVQEYQSTVYPQSVHEGLGAALACYLYAYSSSGVDANDWRSFNLSRWQAYDALRQVQFSLQDYGMNDNRWPVRARTPSNVLYDCLYYDSTEEE